MSDVEAPKAAKGDKEAARRKRYVRERITELSGELGKIRAEKQELKTKTGSDAGTSTEDKKELRTRKAYLNKRFGEARTEMAELKAEKKASRAAAAKPAS